MIKNMRTKDFIKLLPATITKEIESADINLKTIQEIRFKIEKPIIIEDDKGEHILLYNVTRDDMKVITQRISNYSIYAFEEELKQGYITIEGGHRIGISGDCVIKDGRVKTIKNIYSLNMRISREIIGCGLKYIPYIISKGKILNTIIISPPKCGKTTILRDLARIISNGEKKLNLNGKKVSIIDERSEIAGCYKGVPQLDVGLRTDVYDNCIKSEGIIMAIRALSPEVVICDEIGTNSDIESLVQALNSGVNVITTIHGFSLKDLFNRPVFKELIDNNVFKRALILSNRLGVGTIESIWNLETMKDLWKGDFHD